MIARHALRQCRIELVALKSARWEARAWSHYLDYLAISDTPPPERTAAETARLEAALDDCEYCCRRLERIAGDHVADHRVSYDPPLTPGVHPLPAGYVYDPPQLISNAAAFGPRGPRREFGASSRARRGASSAAVLTGMTAVIALAVWQILSALI